MRLRSPSRRHGLRCCRRLRALRPRNRHRVEAVTSTSDRIGVWELGANVLRLAKKMRTIDAIDERTATLEHTFEQIRAKPLEQLKQYSTQSDALAAQADHANSVTLKGVRDQFDTLAWLFQQTSAVLIPLSKEGVLLKQYRHNLSNWRDAIKHQYHDALVALGVRLGILLAMLAVVFAGAEIWRRAVLRYAHETRRRNQLLMVRKVTTWVLVAMIVGSHVRDRVEHVCHLCRAADRRCRSGHAECAGVDRGVFLPHRKIRHPRG